MRACSWSDLFRLLIGKYNAALWEHACEVLVPILRPNEYFSLPQHAVDEFARLMVVELTGLVELLLQRKNLHQKVYLDPDAIEAEIMEHVRGEHKKAVRLKIGEVRRNLLVVTSSRSQLLFAAKGSPEIAVSLTLPDIRRFCEDCQQLALFRPVRMLDAYHDLSKSPIAPEVDKAEDLWSRPLILLAFQCQRCKSTLELFAIKREGWELWLDSRLRMQEIGHSDCLP